VLGPEHEREFKEMYRPKPRVNRYIRWIVSHR